MFTNYEQEGILRLIGKIVWSPFAFGPIVPLLAILFLLALVVVEGAILILR
jgi:hypothetical protein